MKAGITVIHKDGRIGHLFGVENIDNNCMYWFRWKKSETMTYVGEFVSGKYLTKITDEDHEINFQTTIDF